MRSIMNCLARPFSALPSSLAVIVRALCLARREPGGAVSQTGRVTRAKAGAAGARAGRILL